MVTAASHTRRNRRGGAGYLPPLVLCAAIGFALLWASPPADGDPAGFDGEIRLLTFEPASADDLLAVLDAAWERTALPAAVPSMAPAAFPEDMATLPVEDKKRAFVRAVLPHVLRINRGIRRERERLLALRREVRSGGGLDEDDRDFLRALGTRYRLDPELLGDLSGTEEEAFRTLVRRVDVVPPSLALAQAAIESAWGGSRFVRLGNSLFGQWVFSADKGLAPQDRPEGADYAVAAFDHLGEAVRAYVANLNTFAAYRPFRDLRREMRERGAALDPYRLARGLLPYSVRREAYVAEVREVIRRNGLTRFDGSRLAHLDALPASLRRDTTPIAP